MGPGFAAAIGKIFGIIFWFDFAFLKFGNNLIRHAQFFGGVDSAFFVGEMQVNLRQGIIAARPADDGIGFAAAVAHYLQTPMARARPTRLPSIFDNRINFDIHDKISIIIHAGLQPAVGMAREGVKPAPIAFLLFAASWVVIFLTGSGKAPSQKQHKAI